MPTFPISSFTRGWVSNSASASIKDMEPASEGQSKSRFRSQLSWKSASMWALFPTAFLFLILNRNGCWFYRHDPTDLVLFVYVFIWLLVFFALAATWRLLLLIGTVIVLVPLVGMRGVAEMNSGPESAAVHTLHELNSNLQRPNNGERQRVFPDKLPMLELSPLARKFYRFDYIPNRSADGEIRSYLIEAVPSHRGCDLERSFTITSENEVFWTMEPRPASASDARLNE
jgi:hypothetical protein